MKDPDYIVFHPKLLCSESKGAEKGNSNSFPVMVHITGEQCVCPVL